MKRLADYLFVILAVVCIVLGVVLVFSDTSHPSAEKGYIQPTERPVRMLIAQEQTVEAQLADRSILVAQQRATVLEACDLIAALDRPSTDVATWSASHCMKGEK